MIEILSDSVLPHPKLLGHDNKHTWLVIIIAIDCLCVSVICDVSSKLDKITDASTYPSHQHIDLACQAHRLIAGAEMQQRQYTLHLNPTAISLCTLSRGRTTRDQRVCRHRAMGIASSCPHSENMPAQFLLL